jgi:FMN hydrolase / 5-amino-6-(5-phospho-D-ribitylamino)uracil phosphatase
LTPETRTRLGGVRAICFDLDNTLWDVGPVLLRAERILADWLRSRYPKIMERFSEHEFREHRLELLRSEPAMAHNLTWLRRESIARLAEVVGYDRAIAQDAFDHWHLARNDVSPYADVLPSLDRLRARFRLATLTNGNADLERIGLAHHFEVRLAAEFIGCAKPDARAYQTLADALALTPAEILFVGDEPAADVVGPRSFGMPTVWVNRSDVLWPSNLAPADASIRELGELVDLLAVETVNGAR